MPGKSKSTRKTTTKVQGDPLRPSAPRSHRIGGNVQPNRDLSKQLKWPRYVKVQRQRKVLYQRLKVPPSINQFSKTLAKDQRAELFRLLNKYQPRTKAERAAARLARAKAIAEKTEVPATKREQVVHFGLNHVTYLVEEKLAKFVVIAHDVDPIELVVWLPALCRKMNVPYCIVKGKSSLGQVVHQKTATALAITSVKPEDEKLLARVQELCKTMYNDNLEGLKKWGGGQMGLKTKRKIEACAKIAEEEARKKAALF
jgi:large subunit ribosomal protein L7Ae